MKNLSAIFRSWTTPGGSDNSASYPTGLKLFMGREKPHGNRLVSQKTIDRFSEVRLAQEAMMLDTQQKQGRIVRDSVRALQKEAGYETTPEDDMGVKIGDETHTHVHQSNKTAVMAAIVASAVALGSLAMSNWPSLPSLPQDTDTQYDPGFGTPQPIE